jgi:predicted lactoylglutathione lyase
VLTTGSDIHERTSATNWSALAAGGQAMGEPEDQDFMYMRGFRDLDGHQWSFIYIDMAAIPED